MTILCYIFVLIKIEFQCLKIIQNSKVEQALFTLKKATTFRKYTNDIFFFNFSFKISKDINEFQRLKKFFKPFSRDF